MIQNIIFRLGRSFELPPAAGRIEELEGLRGIAVLLVFFVHFGQLFSTFAGRYGRVLDFLQTIGHSGVDLFFLLSGFLIYGILLRKRRTYRSFLARRAQRIYPAFLALFGLYLLLSFVLQDRAKIPRGWASGIAYVLANLLFLPGILSIQPLISVAWSLSYEFLSYLMFPVLVWSLEMGDWPRRRRVWFWIGLGALFIGFTLLTQGVFIPALRLRPGDHIRLLMFFGGPLLYEYAQSAPRFQFRAGHEPAVMLGCAAAWSVMYLGLFKTPEAVSSIALFLAFGFLVAFCITVGGRVGSVLRWPPLRWLGNMSYSYYLVHALTLLAFRYVVIQTTRWSPVDHVLIAVVLPLGFLCTLVTGATLFLLIEKPYSILPPLESRKQLAPHPADLLFLGWRPAGFDGRSETEMPGSS